MKGAIIKMNYFAGVLQLMGYDYVPVIRRLPVPNPEPADRRCHRALEDLVVCSEDGDGVLAADSCARHAGTPPTWLQRSSPRAGPTPVNPPTGSPPAGRDPRWTCGRWVPCSSNCVRYVGGVAGLHVTSREGLP